MPQPPIFLFYSSQPRARGQIPTKHIIDTSAYQYDKSQPNQQLSQINNPRPNLESITNKLEELSLTIARNASYKPPYKKNGKNNYIKGKYNDQKSDAQGENKDKNNNYCLFSLF